MFNSTCNILIVDNEQQELDQLKTVFFENGIPCKALLYDTFFDSSFKDIRIAFFDIKLNPSGTQDSTTIYTELSAALKLYISEDNPPFILVFWTTDPSLIDGFKNFINERKDNVPKPCLIKHIAKNEISAPNVLQDKLKELWNNNVVKLLFDFETKSKNAAANTTDEILKIIPQGNNWGDEVTFENNFKIIFKKLAECAVGKPNLQNNVDKGIYNAIIPIINHNLLSSVDSSWADLLAIDFTDYRSPDYPPSFKIGKLNSILHIEKNILSEGKKMLEKNQRGTVIEIDKNRESTNIILRNNFDDWMESLVGFKKNEEFKASKRTSNAELIREIKKASTFIAVEISSVCDFAQDKSRLHKYLLGIKTPVFDLKELIKNEQREGILNLNKQVFHLNGSDFMVWFNLNYTISVGNNQSFGKPVFLFKKEIIDMIGNRYASHISRIGIINF